MGVMKAMLVRNWSADVVLFPGPEPVDDDRLAAHGIEVVPGEITRVVVEDDRLTSVEVAGRVVPRTAVFLNPTFVPSDGLLTDLGCEVDEQGWVRTDEGGRTSVPGVSAAGNVVDPHSQLITAAGAGSFAAAMLNTDLIFVVEP
jgi:thioredoxin reductase